VQAHPNRATFSIAASGTSATSGGQSANWFGWPLGWKLSAIDTPLVELGNDVGGVGHTAEQPVQLCHDHNGLAFLCGGEELAACGPAGEWLATADSGILEYISQVEFFQLAVRSDALTLSFEAQSAIGLFFAGDSDVANRIFGGVHASKCKQTARNDALHTPEEDLQIRWGY
jgi:hypothetical protein